MGRPARIGRWLRQRPLAGVAVFAAAAFAGFYVVQELTESPYEDACEEASENWEKRLGPALSRIPATAGDTFVEGCIEIAEHSEEVGLATEEEILRSIGGTGGATPPAGAPPEP